MKKLSIFILFSFLSLSVFAQTSNIQKDKNDDLTASFNTGNKTITVEAGGTLDVSAGTVTFANNQIPAAKVSGVALDADVVKLTDLSVNSSPNKVLQMDEDGKISVSVIPTTDIDIAIRRGTEADTDLETIPDGVLAWSEDTARLTVGDGTTAGGNMIRKIQGYTHNGDSTVLIEDGQVLLKGNQVFISDTGEMATLDVSQEDGGKISMSAASGFNITSGGGVNTITAPTLTVSTTSSLLTLESANDVLLTSTGGSVYINATDNVVIGAGGNIAIGSETLAPVGIGGMGPGTHVELGQLWDSGDIAGSAGKVSVRGSYEPTDEHLGLWLGSDVALFRSAADTLRTNDALIVNNKLTVGAATPTTEAEGLWLGSDVALYRSAANTLTTTDVVNITNASTGGSGVAGALNVTGKIAITGSPTTSANGIWIGDANIFRIGTGQLRTTGALTVDNGFFSTAQAQIRYIRTDSTTRSGAGAVATNYGVTALTTTGAAQALTLANGADGQRLDIFHVVDGGDAVLTPTTKTGYTSITFTNVGDSVSLTYLTTYGWMVTASRGATITP